jgi:hypothetical protein
MVAGDIAQGRRGERRCGHVGDVVSRDAIHGKGHGRDSAEIMIACGGTPGSK